MAKRWWNRTSPTVTSGGSGTVGTLTYGVAPLLYVQGQTYCFIVGVANTGAYSLNINGLGAKNVFFGGVACTGGELVVGAIVEVMYDNAGVFQIVGGSAGKASVAGYLPLSGGTLTGALTVPNTLSINGAAGTTRTIFGTTSGSTRWAIVPGNSIAEGGSNAGSDFQITRYNDAGAVIDLPLSINRANGATAFGSGSIIINALASNAGTTLTMNKAAGAFQNSIIGQRAGLNRWFINVGNADAESTSNLGTNFAIQRWGDGGAFIDQPIVIARSSGVTTFSVAIVNGPSDRSLKENIAPLEDSLDKVMALKGVSFNFIKDKTKRQIGLIAQDVAPIVPEVMQDFIQPDEEPKLAIDYTRLVPLLVEAIKELTAKVTRLEAGLATASQA
jgi:hypothetical protein